MILFYTGTGNSEYIARKIARRTGDGVVSIGRIIKEERQAAHGEPQTGSKPPDLSSPDHPYVISVPTYCWRMPRLVEEFFQRHELSPGRPVYFIFNCGDSTGNAVGHARKLCEAKGWTLMGFAQVLMPENFVTMFPCPSADKAEQIIRAADPVIDELATCIAEGRPFPDYHPKMRVATLINPLFYKLFVHDRRFYANDSCTSCGRCLRLCPLDNIRLSETDGRPRWQGDCTQCMACICGCPEGAIHYGRKTIGKTRYFMEPADRRR